MVFGRESALMTTVSRRLRADLGAPSLLLVLAVAAVIRLDNVSQPLVDIYTWRESSVAMMAQNFYHGGWNILYPEVDWVGPGPGYQGREFQTVSFLAALMYAVLGHADWIGRVVSIAFGLAGIVAFHGLTRHIWDDRRAIVAAWLLALAPEGTRIERSFIPDPAMVALVVASFWMLVRYVARDRPRDLVMAVVLGTLGNLTKLPGMIIGLPIAYAAIVMLRRRDALNHRQVRRLDAAMVASAIPVSAYYLWARHLSLAYPPYHFSGEGNWIWDHGLTAWIREGYFVSDLRQLVMWFWGGPLLLLAGAGFTWPLVPALRRMNSQSQFRAFEAPWVFHWWCAAFAVYYAIGALELVQNPSNFHLLSPAIAGLGAHAVISVSDLLATAFNRQRLFVATALLVASVAVSGRYAVRMRETSSWQSYQLGLALRQVSADSDLVVVLGDTIGCPAGIYYSGRRGWLFPPFGHILDWERLPDDARSIQLFEELRVSGAKWFGVVPSRRAEILGRHPRFAAHLDMTSDRIRDDETGVIYRLRPPVQGRP